MVNKSSNSAARGIFLFPYVTRNLIQTRATRPYTQNCSWKTTADKERELVKVTTQIARIIEAITEGMIPPSLKAKMDDLEQRKTALGTERASLKPEQPVLH